LYFGLDWRGKVTYVLEKERTQNGVPMKVLGDRVQTKISYLARVETDLADGKSLASTRRAQILEEHHCAVISKRIMPEYEVFRERRMPQKTDYLVATYRYRGQPETWPMSMDKAHLQRLYTLCHEGPYAFLIPVVLLARVPS
jgi:hypothetical protein